MYDIVIIGSGPSGSLAAKLLGQKYKILIIEKRNLNETDNFKANKACGGLLNPDGQKMLAKLNIVIPKEVISYPQSFSVKVIDFDNNLSGNYQKKYLNINRELFDRYLFSQIPQNVDIKLNSTFNKLEKNGENYDVYFFQNGKEYKENCKIVIGADGANSKVRSYFKNIKNPVKYISIQEWFENDGNINNYYGIFDKSITPFYSWIIPKDNYLIIGSALINDKTAKEKFELLKNKLNDYGLKFNKIVKKEGAFLLNPESFDEIYTGKNNIALIGEAASLISSSSAEGISYALYSGKSIAESILKDEKNFLKLYKKEIDKLKFDFYSKKIKYYCMFNSTLRKIIIKSNIFNLDS